MGSVTIHSCTTHTHAHTPAYTKTHKYSQKSADCIRWVFESASGIFESLSLYVHAIHPMHRSPHLVICMSLLCMCFASAILSHFLYESLSQMSSIDASTCVLRSCVSLLPPSLLSSACAFLLLPSISAFKRIFVCCLDLYVSFRSSFASLCELENLLIQQYLSSALVMLLLCSTSYTGRLPRHQHHHRSIRGLL